MLTGSWDSIAIGTNSPGDESPAYLTTLLDANSAAAPASRDEASKYYYNNYIITIFIIIIILARYLEHVQVRYMREPF